MGPRPQPLLRRTYQQLRLKTLSRREKLSFMAGVLRATGGEADGAYRWPALSGAAQSLERELGATPALPGQQAVRQPGKEVESKFRAGCARLPAVPGGSRGDRSRQFGPSAGSRHRGLRAPGSALAPATGSKLMRGPAYASRSGPPLAGVGGGATRLPWRLAVFVFPAAG